MTGSIWHLAAAMLVFIASHGIPARKGLRDAAIRAFGSVGYHVGYSLLSILVVVWLAYAYADAPFIPVWDQEPWMRWVPVVAMAFASILLVAGMTTPNPFSIGPGGKGFDPERPGILRLTRHPLLWGLTLWAGAHVVPNGDVASLILFGPLLILAAAGPALMEGKRRRDLGADFDRLAAKTSRPAALSLAEIGPARLLGGLALYLALYLLHPLVIGVSPEPVL